MNDEFHRTIAPSHHRTPATPAAVATSLESLENVNSVRVNKSRDDGIVSFDLQTSDGLATREAVFEMAAQNGLRLIGLTQESASLEDIFVEITMREEGGEGGEGGEGETGGGQ